MTRGIALYECKIHIYCVHDAQKKAKVNQGQLFAAIEIVFTPLLLLTFTPLLTL